MAVNWTTLTGIKTVQGSIANWVNRSDLPTDNILIETQAWIYENLRVREMIADEAFVFADNTSSKALSDLASQFVDPVQFIPYEWGVPLPFFHEASNLAPRDSTGTLFTGSPSRWTIIGETAHLDVLSDGAFGGRMMYYFQPPDLSVANETNFLTRRYPRLLRQAAMGLAYEHMKDQPRAQEYLAMAMAGIQSANATNELSRRGQYV